MGQRFRSTGLLRARHGAEFPRPQHPRGCRRNVGTDENIFPLQQGIIEFWWFLLENIQSGACNGTVIQGRYKCLLVYERPPGRC